MRELHKDRWRHAGAPPIRWSGTPGTGRRKRIGGNGAWAFRARLSDWTCRDPMAVAAVQGEQW